MNRTFSASATLLLCALAACGSTPRSGVDGGSTVDASRTDAGASDAAALDATLSDAALLADGAAVPEVRCASGFGPFLIVTRDDLLRTESSVVARLPIQISGAATGLAILGVDETLDGVSVRAWDITTIAAPPGFDGTVTPLPGTPSPTTLFTAVADAAVSELAECELTPWERNDGALTVRLRTNETGELTVTCSIGVDYAARGAEPIELACARGVPGWLGPRPAISGITSPSAFRLMETPTLAHNSGATSVDGFVATGIALRNATGAFPGETACAPPTEWTSSSGRHRLWRGSSSEATWSGPVAAATEEGARWLWGEPGALPDGFCFRSMDPLGDCVRPTISLTLSGTSSVGAWAWESDIFDCFIP